jgi:hypothetical protein
MQPCNISHFEMLNSNLNIVLNCGCLGGVGETVAQNIMLTINIYQYNKKLTYLILLKMVNFISSLGFPHNLTAIQTSNYSDEYQEK